MKPKSPKPLWIGFRPTPELHRRVVALAGTSTNEMLRPLTVTDIVTECIARALPQLEKEHGITVEKP